MYNNTAYMNDWHKQSQSTMFLQNTSRLQQLSTFLEQNSNSINRAPEGLLGHLFTVYCGSRRHMLNVGDISCKTIMCIDSDSLWYL